MTIYGTVGEARRSDFDFDSLVIVRDERDIQSLDLKPTFAGKVLSEGSRIPRSIFACQAASVEAVKETMQKQVLLDPDARFLLSLLFGMLIMVSGPI